MGDNVPEQGVFPLSEALKLAEELELDLVEISNKVDPPVCKIIDYQKYLYQQKKKAKEMKSNASSDPHLGSGKLHGAINIGNVKRRRNGSQHITIGVHRKDWDEEDYYPAYVEYGHGGPGPAPAHPYIRPAYDTRQDEAYEIIRDGLRDAIDKAT